jgi:hypothetical protein
MELMILKQYLTPANINSLGLSLNIIGVILIYKYGLPNVVPSGVKWGANDHNEEKLWKQRSTIGFILLIIGFGLQILSNYPAFIGYLKSELFKILTSP